LPILVIEIIIILKA